MFKFPKERKQGQGQLLFKNNWKVKVGVKIKVFEYEKGILLGWFQSLS